MDGRIECVLDLIVGPTSGTGLAPVSYVVQDNPGPARSGSITAGHKTFIINQDSCGFAITPGSQSFPNAASTGSFQLTTSCTWTAVAHGGWISLTGTTSGTGNATIGFSLLQNTGPARSNTITVGDQSFTITQEGVDTGPPLCRTVVARRLFYANSCFDGSGQGCTATVCQNTFNGGIPCSVDTAIDPTKTAQLPGTGSATFVNYSNYSRGINGIAIDFAKSGDCAVLIPTQSMFVFTVGNVAEPVTVAPPPTSVTLSQVDPNTERLYLRWPDYGAIGSLPNRSWLKVVVLSASQGGIPDLGANDTFYFGLSIGEDNTNNGASPPIAFVTAADEIGTRNIINPLIRLPLADPRSQKDYDKSSTVTAQDVLIVRSNINPLHGLTLFHR